MHTSVSTAPFLLGLILWASTPSAAIAPSPYQPAKPLATAHANEYRYLGRVNPSTRELTWPSTGIAFKFTGTSASVPITNITGTNAIDIFVDGTVTTIDNVSGSNISTPTVAHGLHTVQIRKKSEANFGSIFISSPVTSGTFHTIARPRKRMELIGDSITVGYGEDGVFPCVNTAALEDAPRTYGALTAKNISADYSIVAWSGKGILRNYVTATGDDGQPTMPELWTRYGANDPDNSYGYSYQPSIVVINLGTNDFSILAFYANGTAYVARPIFNMTDYTNALVQFGKKVERKYPHAQLFLTTSPLLSDGYPPQDPTQHSSQLAAVTAAVARIGNKAHVVNFPTQDQSNNNIGCDYHPSLLTHEEMAVILTDAIQAVTG
ncbi:hypothetical protein LTR53_002355 [Teratosphaeriaceae sp. CCFEE 6253]|nr:hypothetical protein LTR53_002355 [Teratosphaeriaceae sp. CCFEE 6253]